MSSFSADLRNRRWGGSVYVLQMFFFVFFPSAKEIWDNRSRERLNGFSWNFYQTIPGKTEFATSCRRLAKVVPPPGECRWFAIRQPFSGTAERIFMKLTKRYRGKWSLQRRAAAWRKSCRRLANVDDLRNLRYDSGTINRGRHARRLRYKIMSARRDLI